MRNGPSNEPARVFATVALLTVLTAAASAAGTAKVIAPPKSEVERLKLDTDFYKKYLNENIPVLSSAKVSDFALLEASYLVGKVLDGCPAMLKVLNEMDTRIVVMAHTEFTTDVPESWDLTKPGYWDKRARGICEGKMVSCAEENLLCFKGDKYTKENIFIHEFGHRTLHGACRLDKTFSRRFRKTYDAAVKKGLWKSTYAGKNFEEYWAEAVQTWFDTNRQNDSLHNHVDTRKELKEYDPALAKLMIEVFGDRPWRYTKVTDRKVLEPHLKGYDPSGAPAFVWPERVNKAWDYYHTARTAAKKNPLHIHIIAGAREYKAVQSLTAWQRNIQRSHYVRCTRSFAADRARTVDNLEQLRDAKLLVLYARRFRISGKQLKMVKDYIASGRPIIAIRTASHAFQNYLEFDREVLGGSYGGHLGDEKLIRVTPAANAAGHPIMRHIKPWARKGRLYRNPKLGDGVTLLLTGKGARETHPLAWTRTMGKQRIFYTSMGIPEDFKDKNFKRLLRNAVQWATENKLIGK